MLIWCFWCWLDAVCGCLRRCLCSAIDLFNATTVNSVGNLFLMLWFVLLFGDSVIWCLRFNVSFGWFVWFGLLYCGGCVTACFVRFVAFGVPWHLFVVLICLLLGLRLLCLW